MRYGKRYGRHVKWVPRRHPSSLPESSTSILIPSPKAKAQNTEPQVIPQVQTLPMLPKNPGKRLLQHVPAHAWDLPSSSVQGVVPSKQNPAAAASRETSMRPHEVEPYVAKTATCDTSMRPLAVEPCVYPEDMRHQIYNFVQFHSECPSET